MSKKKSFSHAAGRYGESTAVPAYCLHKPSGRAVVYIGRRAVYLGAYGSPQSKEAYRRTIATLIAPQAREVPPIDKRDPVSVAGLVEQYLVHAVSYYGADNEYLHTIKAAIAPLLELYSSTACRDFDAEKLETVRRHRIYQGRKVTRKNPTNESQPKTFRPIARVYVNRLMTIIVRIFRWGAKKKLAPGDLWCELQAVESLKKGKFKDFPLRECSRVKQVPDSDITAVLKVVSPEVGAMIRLQLLTAMRPDEVTAMRGCDISQAGKLWSYTIGDRAHGGIGHKTDYREDEGDKIIYLGAKAQTILKPFLKQCLSPTEFLFSPKRAVERRYPNGNAGLKPTARYQDDSFCRAVKRACLKAKVPLWTPHRLRHSGATFIRRKCGIEAAQVVLDHRSIQTAQIYAEKRTDLKREVALKIG